MHSLMMLAVQEGLLESTAGPFAMILIGAGLLMVVLASCFVAVNVIMSDGSIFVKTFILVGLLVTVASAIVLYVVLFGV